METWLDQNPNVTNRLACLVRDFLKVEYLDIAFTVFAAFGIQLVEPFFANTIADRATHSTLKVLYQGIHGSLKEEITSNFFKFDS